MDDQYEAERAATVRDQTRTRGCQRFADSRLSGRMVPCSSGCGARVNVAVGTTEYVPDANRFLALSGEGPLLAHEVARCPACYEQRNITRSNATLDQLAHYRGSCAALATGTLTRDNFLRELSDYAPDWYGDGERFANDLAAGRSGGTAAKGVRPE